MSDNEFDNSGFMRFGANATSHYSSQSSFEIQLEQNLKRLIVAGQGILLAISGGRDSMALLHGVTAASQRSWNSVHRRRHIWIMDCVARPVEGRGSCPICL